jgi:hypothetical protein
MTQAQDYWQDRFAKAAMHNAGAGSAMYRKCLRCGGHALEGSLSAHARWCDKEHAVAVLKAFDDLTHTDSRAAAERASEVRRSARNAL